MGKYTENMKAVRVRNGMYWYILVHTIHKMNLVVYTCTYQYEPVHTNMYIFFTVEYSSLISLFDPSFRGSHRDDARAMQAPAAAHTSCEEGDPRPCPEDEEIFESRPDAADMEEAISKSEECTGYNALHKQPQTLPVPEEKDANSMTQAEAIQGGFFVIWTKMRRKGSPHPGPSELLLNKHAVEYRYITVHTSTYLYRPVQPV